MLPKETLNFLSLNGPPLNDPNWKQVVDEESESPLALGLISGTANLHQIRDR